LETALAAGYSLSSASRFRRHRNRIGTKAALEQSIVSPSLSRKVSIGENHPILVLPRIRADRTTRFVCEDGILLVGFHPSSRLMWFDGEGGSQDALAAVFIDKKAATLIGGIEKTAAGAIGGSPKPLASGESVPMGAGRDGLRQANLLVGAVFQDELKAFPQSGSCTR
jgi:hypothetical protein